LNFLFSRPISVWFYPLKTVSMSEEGFESTYQGSSLLIVQPLNLAVGENSRLRMEMRFERL